jgi:hypothetical protein
MRTPACASLALAFLAVAGCTSGLGQLQTARTLPPGEFRQSVSTGLDRNFMVDTRGTMPGNLVLQYGARLGVSDNVDMGVKMFFGLGALVDAKVQIINRERLALSLLGGAGAAYDISSGGTVLHAPVLMLASYRVADGFTPYAGAGYGAFWIFNYGSEGSVPPGSTPAPRAWHGDGLMMLHIGFELGLFRRANRLRSALLLEYGYLRPIVDDPGDHYDLAANHLFLAGIQF